MMIIHILSLLEMIVAKGCDVTAALLWFSLIRQIGRADGRSHNKNFENNLGLSRPDWLTPYTFLGT
jgi:hypothetical protein